MSPIIGKFAAPERDCWLTISEYVHPQRGPLAGKRYRIPEWRMRPDTVR